MKADRKEFFKAFSRNPELEKARAEFSVLLGAPSWWLIEKREKDLRLLLLKRGKACSIGESRKKALVCARTVSDVLHSVGRTKNVKRFKCQAGRCGLAIPVVRDDVIDGYVVLCHIKEDVPGELLEVLTTVIKLVVSSMHRDHELRQLYESVKPRAIALSTIHTIHRLVSSALDLKHLLPRIARLSLQTLRAKRCSIMLMDRNRKYLVPHVSLDTTNKKMTQNKIKVGQGVIGKVGATGNPSFAARRLSVPLMGEEPMGVITVWDKVDGDEFTQAEQEILITLSEQAVVAIRNTELSAEHKKLAKGTIRSLSRILDERMPFAGGKTKAFVNIVEETGKGFKLKEEEIRNLLYAAEFHRISHAAIPEKILKKKARLTEQEFEIIKKHPTRGAHLMEPLAISSVPVLLYHHERYNGTGYPKGLKGNQIPIGSRILAVVEAFEAMVSQRAYRPRAKTVDEAIKEIKRKSGVQFDPKVVKVFLNVVSAKNIKNLLKKENLGK